ncbi:MAG: lamin tail domain-containing protein [Ginsengibacter sp.]
MGRKFYFCLIIFLIPGSITKAQITENFSDGDFTNSPEWIGNVSDFVVNNSYHLQSNNTIANHTFYLSTVNTLATNAQWEFWVKMAFNPSSANYIDVYLTASASDVSLNATYGYFVRIGNTDDEISLYRKSPSGTIVKIIDGKDDILNTGNNAMRIKVVRDANNKWTLLREVSGMDTGYTSEGSATDATYTTSSYFGFFIKQSTAAFFQKHFFDDIKISYYSPDLTPPIIDSATAVSNTQLNVWFNEPLDPASSGVFSNYSVNNLGMPVSVVADAGNASLVHLTFNSPFTNGALYTLTVNGVKDVAGNPVNNATTTFSFYTPQQYDVVIDELMADPSPQVGLPNNEWIELKNTSSFAINLKGWKFGDLSGTSGLMPNYILQPDSFVIISTGSAIAGLSSFGHAISVSNFPSLDNDGELIFLSDASGKTIHALRYEVGWYKNELKKNGGWTLEMIDTQNPCAGSSNWKASVDPNGGTPGRKNSVDGINKDDTSPKLLRAFATGEDKLTLVFDEPLDSLKAAFISNYTFNNGLIAREAIALPPLFDKVNITLINPIVSGTVYTITTKNISDCKGNIIGAKNTAQFGLAQDADNLDLVINEILFNPRPMGADYVELYNRSKKIIDLNKIFIANRNSRNIISGIQQVSQESILLFPQQFILLSTDIDAVKNQYLTTNPDAFLKLNSFPSFSNTHGNVIILNHQGNIVDEVAYDQSWHFPLIKNAQGVALERIDYDAASGQSNFHSAAASVGYGTPGYKNSQYLPYEEVRGDITVMPEIFSPDNDGIDDFVTISYSFPSAGFVANITVFDASGRPVRYLQKNSLSGINGYYRWDGLDDKNRKLPQGIYIVYTEIFNVEGKKKAFKNTVVLARRY